MISRPQNYFNLQENFVKCVRLYELLISIEYTMYWLMLQITNLINSNIKLYLYPH